MSTQSPKPRNDIGRWFVLALICLGGSTGGTYLRPQVPHNPNITTEGWIEMRSQIRELLRDVSKLHLAVQGLTQQLAQKQP